MWGLRLLSSAFFQGCTGWTEGEYHHTEAYGHTVKQHIFWVRLESYVI